MLLVSTAQIAALAGTGPVHGIGYLGRQRSDETLERSGDFAATGKQVSFKGLTDRDI